MSIYSKYQRCSSSSCKCANGALHGPYFWHIKYVRKTDEKKGHYKWTYLGKTPREAVYRLSTNDIDINISVSLLELKETTAKKRALAKLDEGKKSATIKIEL